MTKRKLGRTGLNVTELSYGGMELRGPRTWNGRDISEDDAGAILNAVLDAGLNFIDTSYDYGLSEERIGRHISTRRKEFFIATKCGCNPRDVGHRIETNPHVWTRDNIMRNVHGSLERMKIDQIDVLQLHNPAVTEFLENNVVDALLEIQEQGMARFLGISTTYPFLPDFVAMGVFDTVQIPYSLLELGHHEAISLAATSRAGTIIRGGLAQGGPGGPTLDPRRTLLWQEANLDELLNGMTPIEMILRFTLSHLDVHTVIVGTASIEHLHQNIEAAEKGPLPQQLYDELLRRVGEIESLAR